MKDFLYEVVKTFVSRSIIQHPTNIPNNYQYSFGTAIVFISL